MFLQVLFILPPFHDRQQYNDKSTAFDTNMNKERFHNALALSLGYERIVKDKRITIEVDDADDPWVTLRIQGHPNVVRFKASGDVNGVELNSIPAMQEDMIQIVDAVHQAYAQATKSSF
jgi:hypothetical protein